MWDGTLYWSTDKVNWSAWVGSSTLTAAQTGGAGDYHLYVYGDANISTLIGSDSYGATVRWVLTPSGGNTVACTGNIETLRGATGDDPSPTPMAEHCYRNMFNTCTSLTAAPELPATTMVDSCYRNMFYGCTSLTEAPALPATNLAANCYNSMFISCTSLTEAPELPATTLVDSCYRNMFYGCTSLTEAPELPATTLASYCYNYMFSNCTSLEVPVMLDHVETIGGSACQSMYSGATALKVYETPRSGYAKAWTVTASAASGWSESMFAGTGGGFTGAPVVGTTYYIKGEGPTVTVTPTAVDNATVRVFVDGVEVALSGEPPSCNVYSNQAAVVVYTAEAGYVFAGGATAVTNALDTSKDPAVADVPDAPHDHDLEWTKPYVVIDLTAEPYTYEEMDIAPADLLSNEAYKTTKIVMRRIEPGTFTMGDGTYGTAIKHTVTLTKPYYVGVFQVTAGQYQRVTGTNPSASTGATDPKAPVDKVTWSAIMGANGFVANVGARVALSGFGLPTEAQWEYACRAGTQTTYYYGDTADTDPNTTHMWCSTTTGSTGTKVVGTAPGESLAGYVHHPWGLYDMHGNLWEWCHDWYGENYYAEGQVDPVGPASATYRVLRGGSWSYPAGNSSSSTRGYHYPTYVDNSFGFRLVRNVYDSGDCLTFASAGGFTLKANSGKSWDGTLYWSTDKVNWNVWDGSTLTATQTGGAGDYHLYVRGDADNTKITGSSNDYKWVLTPAGGNTVACTGNVETLRGAKGDDPSPTAMAAHCYHGLFCECKSLTTAPALPAKTLPASCCDNMFQGCTSLTTAPELPATTLGAWCYSGMFYGCTSLTNVPALPATTLADASYYAMFYGCTSLEAPAMLDHVTSIGGSYGCQYMYHSAAAMKVYTSPQPGYSKAWRVTASAPSGWSGNMFVGTSGNFQGAPAVGTTYYVKDDPHEPDDCITFTSAGVFTLKANGGKSWDGTLYWSTDKVNWTYWNGTATLTAAQTGGAGDYHLYVYGDTGNTKITGGVNYKWVLTPTGGNTVACTGNVETLRGAKGDNPSPRAMAASCYHGLFYGCASLTTAPTLPATTLANNGYDNMFFDCTSLTTAPELPATTLGNWCYSGMFYGCTSLTNVPALPATILPEGCYNCMFSGCASIAEAPAMLDHVTTVNARACTYMYYDAKAMKVYTTPQPGYAKPWAVNATSAASGWSDNMFVGTSGDFAGAPVIGTIYYVKGDAPPPKDDCLTFTSAGGFTLKANGGKSWDGMLYWSTDKVYWKAWDGSTLTAAQTGSAGDYHLYVCGDAANTKITGGNDKKWVLSPTGENKIACTGNIETLRGATDDDPSPTAMAAHCYNGLFYGCASLTTAPALPATNLAAHCYRAMFSNCTSLTEVPELPATTLPESCYHYMFQTCILLEAPAMMDHVTAIGSSACQNMYVGALAMKVYTTPQPGYAKAWVVNATSVASGWSTDMFKWTSGDFWGAPVIGTTYYIKGEGPTVTVTPAAVDNTTVKVYTNGVEVALSGEPPSCSVYSNQTDAVVVYTANAGYFFKGGATAVTNALDTTKDPAVADVPGAPYNSDDCITFTSAGGFTLNTSNGKSWGGTLYWSTDKTNWKVWDGTTTLTAAQTGGAGDYHLYVCGDADNTKITDGSNGRWVLTPAGGNKIACSGNIETLRGAKGDDPSPTPMASDCYNGMFDRCASLTTAPALPATTLAARCYGSMFADCTSLTAAPELPATTLSTGCYDQMFFSCVSLTNAPALPATKLAGRCYCNMFDGCRSLEAPAMLDHVKTIGTAACRSMYSVASAMKVYTTPRPGYAKPWVVNATSVGSSWATDMFYGTGGDFTGAPVVGTTYYIKGGVPPLITVTPAAVAHATAQVFTNGVEVALSGEPPSCSVYMNQTDAVVVHTAEAGYFFKGGATAVTNVLDTSKDPAVADVPGAPHNSDDCLTFTSAGGFTLKANNGKSWDGTLYWSTDKVNWKVWDGTTTLTAAQTGGASDYHLYVCGDADNTWITGGLTGKWVLTPAGGNTVACSGNIETLRGATGGQPSTRSMEISCYDGLFSGCTSLTEGPTLPATNLAENCYAGLFRGCTALTEAPVLPAMELATGCFAQMFQGCTSLTNAPAIPATTLASSCYSEMFSGCKSLTEAPALPATNLAVNCYFCLFYGCTSLTEAPELPATNLADWCYGGLFSGCKSLTEAPELPATTLAANCYAGLFENCTSLTNAPALQAANLAARCYRAMFSGCKSLTEVPELPATTLAESCYVNMFANCTSLEVPVMLDHVKTIGSSACQSMYSGDTALKVYTTPQEGYTKLWRVTASVASGWSTDMFLGTGGDFTGAPVVGTTYFIKGEGPRLPITVTPPAVDNTTVKVYTNGVEVALSGEPPSCSVYTNQPNAVVVYTANEGYYFPGGATAVTNALDTTKDPAVIKGEVPAPPAKPIEYRYPVYNTPGDPSSGIASWESDEAKATLVQTAEEAVTWGAAGETSWYAVTNAGVVLCDGAACQGDVNLILCEGAWLEITNGVSVAEDASFTVYGQSNGAGEMWAFGNGGAGIAGSHITLNGGTIAVSGTGALIGGDGASGVSVDNWVSPEAKVVFDLVGAEVVWAFEHAAIVTPDELTEERVLMTGVGSWTGPEAFQLMKDDWLAHSKPLTIGDEDGTPFADAVLKLNVADGALKLTASPLPDDPVVKDENGNNVTIVVPDEWREKYDVLDEDVVDTKNPMENGMPAWQDYALGLDPNNIYSGIYADSPQNTAADKVTIETKNLDVQKLAPGYGVKYRLDTKLRGKGEYTKGDNQDDATFEVTIDGDDPTGVYKLNAVIFSNGVEIAQSAEAVNIVGMLKQTQAVTNAIISVPWSRLAPGLQEDIGVTNVVKTATLDEGDELRVYRPGRSTYEGWTLDANKQWVPCRTLAVRAVGTAAISEAADPTDATIPRGSGIWLCRKNPSNPYYLYGQAEGEASVELARGPNLIGATGIDNYYFNEHILNAQPGDTIMVPQATSDVPKRFEYKNGSWGYMKGTVVEKTVAGRTIRSVTNTWTTDESFVPAGTGFWLHNNSGKITVQ